MHKEEEETWAAVRSVSAWGKKRLEEEMRNSVKGSGAGSEQEGAGSPCPCGAAEFRRGRECRRKVGTERAANVSVES